MVGLPHNALPVTTRLEMEDDWGSPWADADDRDRITSTVTLTIAAIGEVRGGDGAKDGNGGGVSGVRANAAAHVHDGPWAADTGGGFDAAWTPDARQEDWGGFADGFTEGLLRPVESSDGDLWQGSGGARKTSHPISTEEANAWGAGPDWGDQKTPDVEAVLRLDGLPVGLGVGSPEGSLGKDNPTQEPDTSAKAQIDGNERNARDGESVTGEAALLGLSERVEAGEEAAEGDWGESPTRKSVQDTPQAVLGAAPVFAEAADTSSIHITEPSPAEVRNERETRAADDPGTGDDDDDFGDFAEEAEFEGPEEGGQTSLCESVASPSLETAPSPVPISFDVDTSLVSKLYPIPTSYPEPPPIEEIISTIES